jgi:hypothetical protein
LKYQKCGDEPALLMAAQQQPIFKNAIKNFHKRLPNKKNHE